MNRFIHFWNRIFPLPRAIDKAREQLSEAELALLSAHYHAEHYQSEVQMLKGRVQRLKDALNEA
jgi:hypothetical protein